MPYNNTTLRIEVSETNISRDFMRSFLISLRAQNRSPRTLQTYQEAILQLAEFLEQHNMPCNPLLVGREHIEEFITHLLDDPSKYTGRPLSTNTAANRYRSLHAFFNWLVAEDEIPRSPMERMKCPKVGQTPPTIISHQHLTALLKACEGKSLNDRRDTALVTLLIDTGLRRGEIAGIGVDDINWSDQNIRVTGKGRKVRLVPFGNSAAIALNRYIRSRRILSLPDWPDLWVSLRGPIAPNSIYQAIARRARIAGIPHTWTHLFRHSFAHYFLEAGGQERDLKCIGGWESDAMVRWYGSSAAQARAQKAHRDFSPGDRLIPHKNK